ncbi:MAG: hypothetical protein V1709_07305 [Planctomycetota bacterium]
MPNKGYIPSTDADFEIWQANFVAKVVATPTAYGLVAADVIDVAADSTDWQTDLAALVVAQNAAKGAAEEKDEARDALESEIRSLVKRIQARPATTDAQREELGITVPDLTRTPLSEQIVLTTPPPIVEAKCTGAKTVRIGWYPTQDPGESEALPQGINGVSIFYAEGGIPSDESQWKFLALDTNSPYIHNVANDATITIAYKAQWFDRRKRMGPFGNPVVVAVTA